jgi:hypothetical protein
MIIYLQIYEYKDGNDILHWNGESNHINITKTNTTISFNTLKRYEDW